MLKQVFLVFLVISIFSCQNKTSKDILDIDEINALQIKIDTIESDSNYSHLKRLKKVLANNNNYPDSLRAENNYLLGIYFKQKKEFDSAAIYFHRATDFVNDSVVKERQGKYFQNAYNTYRLLGLYGDGLTMAKKFKSLIDTSKQVRPYIWAMYWEKDSYIKLNDFENALKTQEEQVSFTKLKERKELPSALAGLASLKYSHLNDVEGAFSIFEDLLKNEDSLTLNFKRSINGNYGVYLYYEGNYKKALKHYIKASRAAKLDTTQVDYINNLANTYNNIGEVYLDLKEYEKSRLYLDSVRQLGVNNLQRRIQKSLLNYELRLASETNKNLKEVFTLLDSINAFQDKTYEKKLSKELLALSTANEKEKVLLAEKQAAEIKNLRLENRLIILFLGTLLLATIGFLMYRQRKYKFEKQSLKMQQRLLRSQMNPHFTFNTLYAIQNTIKENPLKASDYLLKFSRLLRLILENSLQNYIDLNEELESLKKYMDLQLIRFPKAFTYKINLEDDIKDKLFFIPPMLLQPFVENSIEHGFSGINYIGEISIHLKIKGKFLDCTIEDNGLGFSESKNNTKESSSLKLISDFILKATGSKLEITDRSTISKIETGLRVSFLIPYKLTEDD